MRFWRYGVRDAALPPIAEPKPLPDSWCYELLSTATGHIAVILASPGARRLERPHSDNCPKRGWLRAGSGPSENLETASARVSVHKFPFLEVSPSWIVRNSPFLQVREHFGPPSSRFLQVKE